MFDRVESNSKTHTRPEIVGNSRIQLHLSNLYFDSCLMLIYLLFIKTVLAAISLHEEYLPSVQKLRFQKTNERLFRKLFRTYNPFLPPFRTNPNITDSAITTNDTDIISITLMYTKLLEVNPPRQSMTMLFEYGTTWRDERLTWNPEEFDGIDHIYVRRDKVWVPEITSFDSIEVKETRPEYKNYVIIYSSGWNYFYISTLTTVLCAMDVRNFPFDFQNCSVKLLSYTFDISEVFLVNSLNEGLDIKATGNDEWQVINISCQSELIYDSSAPTLINEFKFHMKRNPSYYVALIIVPSLIQTAICIAGMFSSRISKFNNEKFAMGLTTITSGAVTVGIVSTNIPKTEKIPSLSNYVMLNLIIISFAIGVIIVVPKFYMMVGWCAGACCNGKVCCNGKREKKKNRCRSCCSGFCAAIIDIFFFIVFETAVGFNAFNLIANKEVAGFLGLVMS